MTLNFDKYAQEGNRYINDLAKELGYPEDRDRTARVLRTVLNAVRDMLPDSENLQLASQLPMFLKAVYLEGYTLRKRVEKPRQLKEFTDRVKSNSGRTSSHDFKSEEEVEKGIQTVLSSLRQYISQGEMEDIIAHMPKGIKQFISPIVLDK